uniref:carbohydrate ABC transporter permease n=1 Tax=Nonomuraea bangladeshensis TaxID=404385 RepID=UPI003F499C07
MRHHKYRFILSLLALPVTLYCVLVLSPYAQAFMIALTDWQGLSPDYAFIGLDNFATLLDDPVFWIALKHNLFLLISIPVIVILLALFFAAMVSFGGDGIRGVRGARLYRAVYFFPNILSVAVIAVLWRTIYEPRNGLLNGFLGLFGAEGAVWLGDRSTALASIAAVEVWTSVGFYIVLFTAAMSAIPRELFEAAMIDGSGRLHTFRRITVPLMWDAIQVAVVYVMLSSLNFFGLVNILSQGPGGPDNSSQVISLYIYDSAFKFSQMGYASAIGVVLFALTLILTFLVFRVTRRTRVEF